MTLRQQLLAVALLTLLLPWAGLRFLQQSEESLRQNHEELLLAIADTIASQIEGSPDLVGSTPAPLGLGEALYGHSLSVPAPRLDGYRADWRYAHEVARTDDTAFSFPVGDGVRVWFGVEEPNYLYLFVEVEDEDIVYQTTPGRAPHGDRVALLVGSFARNPQAYLLATGREGSFRAQSTPGPDRFESTGEIDANIVGYWREMTNGYAIEARIPLRTVAGGIGIGVIDTDQQGSRVALAAATWGDSAVPNALIREWPELERLLRPFEGSTNRFRVLDQDGWVLADSGPLPVTVRAGDGDERTLTERFFRFTLRREDPLHTTLESRPGRVRDPRLLAAIAGDSVTAWFGVGTESSAVVAAAVPIRYADGRQGAVLLEQSSDPVLTLGNQATRRLMSTTGLIILTAVTVLLGFASFLSFRIRRLARAAESALGPRGEITVAVPGTRARDEIGSLARSFADLLGRLREYTDYLQSLKSKLSHELRTPLAIVATSLDNLEQEAGSATSRAYLERLRQGTNRLESILQAMTAATRVEQAITQTEPVRFDVVAVLASCVASYRDVYPAQRFELELPTEPVIVDGSAELIAQLLDKLIDNAVSFAAAGTPIEVRLELEDRQARLGVTNRGPLLPDSMRHRLFDSLVSVRASGGQRAHLGLGLYIVTLIAEFHRGRVEAANLPDGSGVRIGVALPR